jgi:UDP-glucose 4-epimerase
MNGKRVVVCGGAGFIGSHLVDRLVASGNIVTVVDNFFCCDEKNFNDEAVYLNRDIRKIDDLISAFRDADVVFNTAAIARTPWCIDDPILCYETNVMGTLNVLEAARKNNVPRVVLSSSNVVYAFDTPYRTSKEAVERLGDTYVKMYGQSVISLRYSNVYGKRQLETGPSPNVFAALRKTKKELGKIIITGDGEQSRGFTHVSDIVAGNIAAAESSWCGHLDLCTGINTSMNQVARFFNCPVEYIEDRPGDIKHIFQDPTLAKQILGWTAKVKIEDGINDCL